MARFTYFGSLVIALTLLVGSAFFASSFPMTFVATSVQSEIVRAILVLLMFGLIVTEPPRSRIFRVVLGAASVGFVVWSIQYVMNGSVVIADSVLFLHAALSFGIAALEPNYDRTLDTATA